MIGQHSRPVHYYGLELLRFCAAAMVASLHLWGRLAYGGGLYFQYLQRLIDAQVPRILPHPLPAIAFTGAIGVQIFFMISGFVIASSASRKPTVGDFLFHRFLRLAPALWICTLVSALVLTITGYLNIYDVGSRVLRSIILLPFGPKIDDIVWTLDLEIVFYAYVAGVIAVKKVDRLVLLGGALALVSTLFWTVNASCALTSDSIQPFACSAFNDPYVYKFTSLSLVQHGGFFGLGVVLWDMTRKKIDFLHASVAAVSLLACCMQLIWTAAYYANAYKSVGSAQSPVLILAVWFAALLLFCASIVFNSTIQHQFSHMAGRFRLIGLTTYPLYLLNGTIGTVLLAGLLSLRLPEFASVLLSFFITSVFALLIALYAEPDMRAGINSIWMRMKRRLVQDVV